MPDQSGERVLVCRVGEQRLVLSVSLVREVCTGLPLVRMPGVAPSIEGVANVRGTLVTVVRGADLLGLEAQAEGASPWLVVLRSRGGRIGVGVDDVVEVGAGEAGAPFDLLPALEPVFGRID